MSDVLGGSVAVDVHWHHVPSSFVEAVLSGSCPISGTVEGTTSDPVLVLDGGFRQDFPAALTDASTALQAMDRAGLDYVAASVAPPLMHYSAAPEAALAVARSVNDGLAELAAASPRFRPLATVPLQSPAAAADELRRAVSELGLSGVQIDTNVAGDNLGDEKYRPFWRQVADLDCFVFLHPGPASVAEGHGRLSQHGLVNFVGLPVDSAFALSSLVFDGVYEEFGTLKTCFAHGGGAFPALLGRWEHGYQQRLAARTPSVRSPSSYLESVYCDSLTHSDAGLAFLLRLLGRDNVLLGSDYPFDMGEPEPVRAMTRVVTDDADRRVVGGLTAARLLGIGLVSDR